MPVTTHGFEKIDTLLLVSARSITDIAVVSAVSWLPPPSQRQQWLLSPAC